MKWGPVLTRKEIPRSVYTTVFLQNVTFSFFLSVNIILIKICSLILLLPLSVFISHRTADSLPAGYPEITTNPRRYMVIENNRPAIIYCGATGNPEPEILWFKESVPVEPTDRIFTVDCKY